MTRYVGRRLRRWVLTWVNIVRCSRPWVAAENGLRRVMDHHDRTMRVFEQWVRDRP